MILTVAPNPALDKTVVLPGFEPGRIYRPSEVITLAGGKGFNFARALQSFNQPALVVAPVGGYQGQRLTDLALQAEMACDYQPVKGETRVCLTIVDPSAENRLTEIYEQGTAFEPGDWEKLVERTATHFNEVEFLAVCGSFPPGVPTRGLYDLIIKAMAAGRQVWLDTYGAQLGPVLELRPDLLKINQFEAGQAVGHKITKPDEAFAAATHLQKRGVQQVVITLGKLGAVGLSCEGERFGWHSPAVPAICSTGSGDCLFAGLAASLVHGKTLPDALRWGVAAGAANTLQIGAGLFDPHKVEQLYGIIKPLLI